LCCHHGKAVARIHSGHLNECLHQVAHQVTHRSFRRASPHLWNQLPTSLRIPHPNYSSPSQRPSFEHAGLTCYTLLSPSITFSLFNSELIIYLFEKILSSTLVCFSLSDWSHGSRLFTGRPICSSVLCFSSIFFCFCYSCVWQTKLAVSLVNFWAHYKIVWLIATLSKLVVKTKCWMNKHYNEISILMKCTFWMA